MPSKLSLHSARHGNPRDASRRNFLKGASTVAAGMVAGPVGMSVEAGTLPTVPLGPRRVTRLIVGSNPFRGYSHFNAILNQTMAEWNTDERAAQVLLDCQKAGINTYQSSFFQPRWERIFELFHKEGGKIQWICLTTPSDVMHEPRPETPEWVRDGQLKVIDSVLKFKPIAMVHHGSDTDSLWRAGKIDYLKTYIDKVHDAGCLAGISLTTPATLESIESKGWPVDFYMTALYDLSRTEAEIKKEFGVTPVGDAFFAEDPPRMCEVIRKVKRPCLAYKILAAGRKCRSPREVRQTFEWTFKNIKPTDAVIVGLYPRFTDQITEDTTTVRQICG
jgi:hypothetical protein